MAIQKKHHIDRRISEHQKIFVEVVYDALESFLHREYLSMVVYGGCDVFDTPFNDTGKIKRKEAVKVDEAFQQLKLEKLEEKILLKKLRNQPPPQF